MAVLYRAGSENLKPLREDSDMSVWNLRPGTLGRSSHAKRVDRFARRAGTSKDCTTVELFSGSVMHGELKPIGFTCFEFRTAEANADPRTLSTPRELVISVDSNTEESSKALRQFAQHLPELTGVAYCMRQPQAGTRRPCVPHVRLSAERFLRAVAQERTQKSRNQAILKLCTSAGIPLYLNAGAPQERTSPEAASQEPQEPCSFEMAPLRQKQRDLDVAAMLLRGAQSENPSTEASRLWEKSKLWRALGHKISAGQVLPSGRIEDHSVGTRNRRALCDPQFVIEKMRKALAARKPEPQELGLTTPLGGPDAASQFVWKGNTDRATEEQQLRDSGFWPVDPRAPQHGLCVFNATSLAESPAPHGSLFRVCVSQGQVHCRDHGNTVAELGGLNHLRGITAPLEQASYDEELQQWTKRTVGTLFMLPVKQRSACDLTEIDCAV